jgi:tagatose-1,6-bisphosphate aldolase non-catalytic subunit AgaZ/GatZ
MNTIRVYVNGQGVDVPRGATALDALRVADPDAARLVEEGKRALVDSRGLGLSPTAVLSAGSIVRVVSARAAGEKADGP